MQKRSHEPCGWREWKFRLRPFGFFHVLWLHCRTPKKLFFCNYSTTDSNTTCCTVLYLYWLKLESYVKIRQSTIWYAGSLGQMTRQPSVWCFKYYFFHNFLQNSLQKSFQFIFLFLYKFTKIKIKSFECPKSIYLKL